MARFTEVQLHKELERLTRLPLDLKLTTNASNYISFTPGRNPVRLRLQRIFMSAPDAVLTAIAKWMRGEERRCPMVVRRFINCPPVEAVRAVRAHHRHLRTRGQVHDLVEILAQVNRDFFRGHLVCGITWGRQNARRSVRARTLGCYYRCENLIMINPVLDQHRIPRWFVAFIIYHECLHALQTGAAAPHDRQFRVDLRRHPQFPAAVAWEKENIDLLTRKPALAPNAPATARPAPAHSGAALAPAATRSRQAQPEPPGYEPLRHEPAHHEPTHHEPVRHEPLPKVKAGGGHQGHQKSDEPRRKCDAEPGAGEKQLKLW